MLTFSSDLFFGVLLKYLAAAMGLKFYLQCTSASEFSSTSPVTSLLSVRIRLPEGIT